MNKVSGMMDLTKRTDTALSGSQHDDSNVDDHARPGSFLSHNNHGPSKKSLI